LAIAILGMQYLAIPLHEWLRLSEALTLVVSVLLMGVFIYCWSGSGRLSLRGYVLLIVLLATGGYVGMELSSRYHH